MQKPFSALDTFNEALQIDPKSALCKFQRASLYYNSGRYKEALTELQELQGLAPNEPPVFYLTAKVSVNVVSGLDNLTILLKKEKYLQNFDTFSSNPKVSFKSALNSVQSSIFFIISNNVLPKRSVRDRQGFGANLKYVLNLLSTFSYL